ncbi:MAG TPA: hypothetical protein VFL19_04615 [Nitrospira sp.]|nr:hypothetical protein [Nitrospira sp.]
MRIRSRCGILPHHLIVGLGLTDYQWISLTLVFFGTGLHYYQMETGRSYGNHR